MRCLALDYGDRRVGVALSDPNGVLAFARPFLLNKSLDFLLGQLMELCHKESVDKIVVGLPLHTDGQAGERVEATTQFVCSLEKSMPNVTIEFFDERFTSQWASNKLRQAGIRAKDQKGEKDSLAAQILLQTYLDAPKR